MKNLEFLKLRSPYLKSIELVLKSAQFMKELIIQSQTEENMMIEVPKTIQLIDLRGVNSSRVVVKN